MNQASSRCGSKIVRLSSMQELTSHLTIPSIIFFDIDNTLIRTTTNLGSDEWEAALVKTLTDKGGNAEESFEKAKMLWCAFQLVCQVITVETEVTTIVSYLKRSGHEVLAITARPGLLSHATHLQLKSVGLSFGENHCSKFELEGLPVLYENGIFFCDNCSKGSVISFYLHSLRAQYQNETRKKKPVVLVDDRLSHLESAQKKLDSFNFAGFHYSYVEDNRMYLGLDQGCHLFNEAISHPLATQLFLKGLGM